MTSHKTQVELVDVLRIILQFFKESNFTRSLYCLQEETGIALNAVENMAAFQNDIMRGNWDIVTRTAGTLYLSENSLMALYEQICIELLDSQEFATTLIVLRETAPMQYMKLAKPERYRKLESMALTQQVDKGELFGKVSKEKRRVVLAKTLTENADQIMPSRLLTLLGMALKWQNRNNEIGNSESFDLLKGVALQKNKDNWQPRVTTLLRTISLDKTCPSQCLTYSNNGKYLASGSKDGLIELYDWTTGELADLDYQNEDLLMAHPTTILTLTFSDDSELLLSGCKNGDIKVWNTLTGRCIKKFEKAHDQGISALCFNSSKTQILSGSYDFTARIHSLQALKTLRVFYGHASYINSAFYSSDNCKVITGSSDGKIKIWDAKHGDCLMTFSPPPPPQMNENDTPPIYSIKKAPNPLALNSFFVCTKSNTLYHMDVLGQTLKRITILELEGNDFTLFTVSPCGSWIYAAADNGKLYTISIESGTLVNSFQKFDSDIVALAHHPVHPILSASLLDGNIHIMGH